MDTLSFGRDHTEVARGRRRSIDAVHRRGLLCALMSLCLTSCLQVPRSAAPAPDRPDSGSGSPVSPVSPGDVAEGRVPDHTSPTCCETEEGAEDGSTTTPPLLRAPRPPAYARRRATYQVPDVVLVNQDAERVSLREILNRPEPVALNFIFTTCTTICPVMAATFAGLEKELSAAGNLRLVSISLDPEYDSPSVLKSFARRYGAGRRWEFLTGGAREIAQVYRAFDAISGSKFSHQPFTLLKTPGETEWLRIEGLVSIASLADEYRRLVDRADSPAGGG